MVHSVDTEGGVRELAMAIGPERSKPPLHNFNLPCLKWGNQRHLRCMKVSDSAAVKDKNIINGTSADRIRTIRSPPTKFFATRDYEVRRFKKLKPINDKASGLEEGIEAVREKLMCDFKAAADKLKATILRKGVSEESDEKATQPRPEQEEENEKEKSPLLSQSAAVVVETEEDTRPWNLRTRRNSCKAPIGENSVNGKALRIEEKRASNYSPARSENAKSPRLRGEKRDKEEEKEKQTEQPRPKFAVALTRKEIEEDFMEISGHRPARRPKKRPRNVQKQLDMLFPGLWLTEVTADSYKVPELPDNGKSKAI